MAISRSTLRILASVSASAALIGGVFAPAAGAQSSDWLNLPSSSLPSDRGSNGGPAPDEDADGPKNIIYMIGDGMGYNHVAAANLYESGQTRYQVEGETDPGQLEELAGDPVQVYEGDDWNHLAMTTFQEGNSYDGQQAWSDHNYVNENYTDSAAAGTAMATGEKTSNGSLGVNSDGEAMENTSERAKAQGKAAGVVSDVPFSHATPAAWAAHNPDRNDYHSIAHEMLHGDLDVIMGAGHPFYDADNERLAEPDYGYISEEDFAAVSTGDTDFEYFEEDADFQALADGEVEEDTQYFGLAQVESTLQHDRSGDSEVPYDVEQNDVVDLATMSEGALNALNTDDDGFHLMIEGGAIDWAGHANDIARDIEEVQAFNDAVDVVVDWVEDNSSWDETLLIVTADHETGYLSGQDEELGWKALHGAAGEVPAHDYYSGNHTNQVVPFFYKGAGSEDITASVTGSDPVRGDYIDNVTVANLTFNEWWTED